MSIANRQIRNALDRILRKAFQSGYLPSFRESQSRLADYFRDKIPGLPTFKVRPAIYRGESCAEDWNNSVDEIKEDLDVAYEECIDQTERILTNFDYSETEKKKIDLRIKVLEKRLDELMLLNTNGEGFLYSFHEKFHDLLMVDQEETNAYIDLSNGTLNPSMTKVGTKKLSLYGATATVQVTNTNDLVSSTSIRPVGDALDDYSNTAWLQKIVMSSQAKVGCVFTLNLPPQSSTAESRIITRITVKPHVSLLTSFTIMVTEDGVNWGTLLTKTTVDEIVCDIPEYEVKSVKVIMNRSDSDEHEQVGGKTCEVYYFGIANISLLKMDFEDECTYTSIPITINDRQGRPITNISKVSIEAEQEVYPPYSWINYYIAMDEGTPHWQAITPFNTGEGYDQGVSMNRPPKTIDFKVDAAVGPTVLSHKHLWSNAEGDDTFNGLNVYSVLTAQGAPLGQGHHIIPGSCRTYRGVNQWMRESYPYVGWSDNPLHKATGSDWNSIPVGQEYITRAFTDMSLSQFSSFIIPATGVTYRYSTNLLCRTSTIPIRVYVTKKCSLSIYINNQLIGNLPSILEDVQSVSIDIPVSDGWNRVEICAYNLSDTSTTITLYDFCPPRISLKILADTQELKQVSPFDICYNVRERDNIYYALTECLDTTWPEFLINATMMVEGASYEVSYNYYKTLNNPKLLVKIEMGKLPGSNPPPKVLGYKVRVMA